MGPTKDGALYAEDPAFQMHITVRSARCKRKTGTDARKLLIWAALRLTYFTNEKNMGSKEDSWNRMVFSVINLSDTCVQTVSY